MCLRGGEILPGRELREERERERERRQGEGTHKWRKVRGDKRQEGER